MLDILLNQINHEGNDNKVQRCIFQEKEIGVFNFLPLVVVATLILSE